MARDRLKQLKHYLHFCYLNQQQPPANDPTQDRLHKIRPVVMYLQEKFETLYYPKEEIVLGESMIPFKGRLKFKHSSTSRMPLKPVKNGIKVFVLSESSSGYCYKFEIYLGKDGDEQEDAGDLGKTKLLSGFSEDCSTEDVMYMLIISTQVYHCFTFYQNVVFTPVELSEQTGNIFPKISCYLLYLV